MFMVKKYTKKGYTHVISYPVPLNINYFFGFGFAAMICLLLQLLTGIFISMHYTPNISYAFGSVEHIMRDVNMGWFLRLLHANGASFFFIIVYLHIARGLYYQSFSFPRGLIWCSGIVIFLLMMATAFMGYVLPWGQMSFWGATVIINLFTAFPVIGVDIATFLWGGFSVDNPTLNRFYSLHYLVPFILIGMVFVHISLLHCVGSTNSFNSFKSINNIFFYPYFFVKDFFGFFLLFFFLFIFVFFYPNSLGHSDNFIEANPMVTPLHIVPEWYFLPFYAILRSIPDKLGGVVAMFASILVLFFLPVIRSFSRSDVLGAYVISNYRVFYKFFTFCFFYIVCCLGWLGSHTVEAPYIFFGQVCTFLYFFYFYIVYIITRMELLVYYNLFKFKFSKSEGESVRSKIFITVYHMWVYYSRQWRFYKLVYIGLCLEIFFLEVYYLFFFMSFVELKVKILYIKFWLNLDFLYKFVMYYGKVSGLFDKVLKLHGSVLVWWNSLTWGNIKRRIKDKAEEIVHGWEQKK